MDKDIPITGKFDLREVIMKRIPANNNTSKTKLKFAVTILSAPRKLLKNEFTDKNDSLCIAILFV